MFHEFVKILLPIYFCKEETEQGTKKSQNLCPLHTHWGKNQFSSINAVFPTMIQVLKIVLSIWTHKITKWRYARLLQSIRILLNVLEEVQL